MAAHSLDNPVYTPSTESIKMETSTADNLDFRFSQMRSNHWNRWKYRLLALVVSLALVLAIVSLGLVQREETEIQRYRHRRPVSSAFSSQRWYCGTTRKYRLLADVYVAEGIDGAPNSEVLYNLSSFSACHEHCLGLYGRKCGFFSFDPSNNDCVISSADFYSAWTLAKKVNGARTCYKVDRGAWKTLYRRPKLKKSGYIDEVTGPWMDENYYTNGTLSDFDADKSTAYDWTILKSQLTNFWEGLDVQKVKVSLFKDGKEVHYLVFDGLNSNSKSWFKKPFLLDSSWKDLGPGKPPMYLDWYFKYVSGQNTGRSMYVAAAHRGCSSDWLWMALIQNQNTTSCPWETVGRNNVPRLFYAPGDTHVVYSGLEDADYISISISFPFI